MNEVEPVAVERVLGAPRTYEGRALRVSGKIAAVCQAKGCWLRIGGTEPHDSIFVKFTCPVEGRLIPLDAVGHEVIVEGELAVEEISKEEARHYAEDAGATAEEVAAIVGSSTSVRMASPSATIYGLEAKTAP